MSDNDWVEKLAASLDRSARSVQAYANISFGTRVRKPQELTNEQYRNLINEAAHDHKKQGVLNSYWPKLKRRETKEIEILLLQHPVVREAHARCKNHHPLLFLTNPLHMPPVIIPGLSFSIALLSACALKHGGAKTALNLRKLIEDGERRELPACELTLFHGINVEQSFKITDGMTIEPWECVNAAIDPLDQMSRTRSPDYARLFSGAVKRTFKWGPAILPANEFENVEIRFQCHEEADTTIELLSVLNKIPIEIIGVNGAIVEDWIIDLRREFYGYGFKPLPGIKLIDGAQPTPLSAVSLSDSRRVFKSMENFNEGDRELLRLAIRRLSLAVARFDLMNRQLQRSSVIRYTSFNSRTGKAIKEDYDTARSMGLIERRGDLAAKETILELAIASEILYALPSTGKKKLLADRIADFMSEDSNTHRDICTQVEEFYKIRSLIVHGNVKNHSNLEEFRSLIDRAFSWTSKALERWLEEGRKPNWSVSSRGNRDIASRNAG